MAPHHRAPNSKREEFRSYLEKGGVLDSLTCVLASLYQQEERPSDALGFIKQKLSAASNISTEAGALQQLTDLRHKFAILSEENQRLKAKLLHYEPKSENRD